MKPHADRARPDDGPELRSINMLCWSSEVATSATKLGRNTEKRRKLGDSSCSPQASTLEHKSSSALYSHESLWLTLDEDSSTLAQVHVQQKTVIIAQAEVPFAPIFHASHTAHCCLLFAAPQGFSVIQARAPSDVHHIISIGLVRHDLVDIGEESIDHHG